MEFFIAKEVYVAAGAEPHEHTPPITAMPSSHQTRQVISQSSSHFALSNISSQVLLPHAPAASTSMERVKHNLFEWQWIGLNIQTKL